MQESVASESDRPVRRNWGRVVLGAIFLTIVEVLVLSFLGIYADIRLGYDEVFQWWAPSIGLLMSAGTSAVVWWRWPAAWQRLLSALERAGDWPDDTTGTGTRATATGDHATAQSVEGSNNIVQSGRIVNTYGAPTSEASDVPGSVLPRFHDLFALADRGSEILDFVDEDRRPVNEAISAKVLLDDLLRDLRNGNAPHAMLRQTIADYVEKAATKRAYTPIREGQEELIRLIRTLRV